MNSRFAVAAFVGLALLASISKAGCGGPEASNAPGGGVGGKAGAAGAASTGGAGQVATGGASVAGIGGSSAGGAGGCTSNFEGSADGFRSVAACPTDYNCGPGCTPLFSVSYPANALSEFQMDGAGVVDTTRQKLLFRRLDDVATYTVGVATGTDGLASPLITPSYILGRQYALPVPKDPSKQSTLMIWDRTTGASVRKLPMPGSTGGQSPYYFGGAATDKYALFSDGKQLLRFDLASGAIKNLGETACAYPQMLGDKYACTDEVSGQFTLVDVESGAVEHPGAGPAIQVEGRCATDGTQCAWVDYRDPPGTKSDLVTRFGGEIYVYTFATKRLERVTFDSPGKPTWKFHAAVDGDLVVWAEASRASTEPERFDSWVSSIDRIAKYDRATGMKCRYSVKMLIGSFVHKRRLYATRAEVDQDKLRVVTLDLDSADVPWVCEPSPAPQVVP